MREIDGIPVYNITLEKEYSDGEDLGIDMIAFTDSPAIKVKGLAFKTMEKKQFFADDAKMRIAAPAMIPMDIYRADEDGEYYVNFSADVIEQIYSKFMSNLTNKDIFNLEHEADKKVPAYLLESFIVDSDAKIKMVKQEYGVDVPKGTVFVVSQVTDRTYYNELVKSDRIGFSIEGFLGLKLNKHNKMENQKYELDGKFYEVVDNKLVEIAMEEEMPEVEATTEEVVQETTEVVEAPVAPEVSLMDGEEEKEEEVEANEEVVEEELAVDPELDSEAVLAIVAPALDALRSEIVGMLADKQNEEEEVEEVEMEEVKLSGFQRLSNYMLQTK
jgi:hypothetical protein